MIVLETERLLVRHLEDSDFAALQTLCSNPAIIQYMGDGQPLSEEQTRDWIKISQNNYQKQGFGCFALLDRHTNQMIGFGGLVRPGEGQVEIIYAFEQPRWGQGLATEFARAMIQLGFERWQLPRIEATIDPANHASSAVVKKLGMTFLRSGVDEHNLPTDFYALDNPAQISH
ncbi:GNAT family N-acetyltransferase [Dictyobacter kobayashii]|uniref:N-acetyltransferase n=1 Tax=Dictyobacter kobayashii TaxID=2014872 RepID=A0A402AR06_9CHLR|nr:GNAT family N-acetyltransferase [Dictyobacter kobayashii]GCE21534.1 N-acetyltransferase [Dictyobacter kobayashii]